MKQIPIKTAEEFAKEIVENKPHLIEIEDEVQKVDPEGIEPSIHPCHGRVLPVYYGPPIKIKMVDDVGIEPTASSMSTKRSTTELVVRKLKNYTII